MKPYFLLRTPIPRALVWTMGILSLVLSVSWYVWKSENAVGNPQQETFFPTAQIILQTSWQMITEDHATIRSDIYHSTYRVFAGFLLAAFIAVPIGVLMGAFKIAEAFFQPWAEFIRYIPVPALIPLFIAIFGVGEEPKIYLIFVGTFFPLLLMVADEIRRVGYDLIKVAHTLGASQLEIMTKVLWRSALPGIFDALRICHGWAWTYLVVAELIATNEGLGIRIMKFARFIQMPKIMLYLVILGLLGLTLDMLFRAFNRYAFRWADTSKK